MSAVPIHLVAWLVVIALQSTTPLAPAETANVITPDGATTTVRANALAGITSSAWPGWVALQPRHPERASEPQARSLMTLDDGQRFNGNFEMSGSEMRWRCRDIGLINIDLERLQWIGPPSLFTQPAPTKDVVVMVNGDHVEGFINTIDPERGVQVESGADKAAGADGSRWIDLSRTECIRLSGRSRPVEGWRIWLRDGTVVHAQQWSRSGDQLNLQGLGAPGGPPSTTVPWTSVVAIAAPGGGMRALWSQPWAVKDQQPRERLTAPTIRIQPAMALDLCDVDLHGPGSFTVQVPEGDWNLCATLDVPPQLAGEVACTVRITNGGVQVLTHRLEGRAATHAINVPVKSGEITIQVTDSDRGAYGAALRLRQPMLVKATAPSAAATTVPAEQAPKSAPGPG